MIADLFRELAELSATLARIAAIQMEPYAPAQEPAPIDEFVEIEGVTTI